MQSAHVDQSRQVRRGWCTELLTPGWLACLLVARAKMQAQPGVVKLQGLWHLSELLPGFTLTSAVVF